MASSMRSLFLLFVSMAKNLSCFKRLTSRVVLK